jgi:hypothetical protein
MRVAVVVVGTGVRSILHIDDMGKITSMENK